MRKTSLIIQKRYFIFREDAKNILNVIQKKVKKEKTKTVYLDFLKASFFSRSFVYELINIIDDFKNKKIIIRVVNLKPQLENFFRLINKRKREIKKEISGLNKR